MVSSKNHTFKHFSRRRFIQCMVAGGLLTGMGAVPVLAQSDSQLSARMARGTDAPVLRGNEFHLEVAETLVNFTGKTQIATTINGSFPAPTLVWREGETVTIHVHNRLSEDTSIHWHGIILPFDMDGVPGLSFAGIPPGSTFTYRFQVQQNGSYWYHSHSGDQKVRGMHGAIIIEPRAGEYIRADRDHVVLLTDWSDSSMPQVFRSLKQQSDMYNRNRPTVGEFVQDVRESSLSAALERREMWQQMRMSPADLADVSGTVLEYLMNGSTSSDNWTGLFSPGERVRLRFINGAGNSIYDVRIPGLPMTLVQADGIDVQPIVIDEFRFGPGETYDVIIEPVEAAYTLYAQSMDRSGFVRGTLATATGLAAAVPAVDPPQWLGMEDMMGNMDHSNHSEHSQHNTPVASHSLAIPSQTVRHASSEFGPSVDMRVDTPRTNLDDPGVGLRNNGRRVLTAADIRALHGPYDSRLPAREVELHLTGNMERYTWSIDGLAFNESSPVHMRAGERLRVILQNDTMMTHPMHLHGMWSDLETPEGEFLTRRHTILVHPAQRISFLATPEELGRWAWHCHLMFHMDAGMFREVLVTA
jgi:CopA family copper-resistance protein